jgi:tetratricopeptide (TPR) repeat protein
MLPGDIEGKPFAGGLAIMKVRFLCLAMSTLAAVAPTGRSFANCVVNKLAELPVTMTDFRQPMVSARINGTDSHFLLDSGAFWSMISPAAAAELHLKVQPLPFEFRVSGIGGSSEAAYTTVKDFSLANIPFSKVDFIVVGSDVGGGAVGLLGQNILRAGDVEYDLANGMVRVMRAHDCNKAILAYWADSIPYSVIDLEWATIDSPHTKGVAYVNGAKIRVTFDTGAGYSILTLRAAERAGVKPDSPGVRPGGPFRGIGRRPVRTWIAPFSGFKIGDEEVRNTRLRFGDIELRDTDMLIGADFFLSHRVYVASSQRKLYFTYNGGPVFNLDAVPLNAERAPLPDSTAAPAGSADGASTAAATATSSTEPQTAAGGPSSGSAEPRGLEQPTDAAGFSRRGAAFAARHDFDHAIADLTRACELAPNEPQYFYERGVARVSNAQPFQAMSDFDQALKLKPDDVPALMARARLRLEGRDPAGAIADLDAVDRIVPRESDERLAMGNLYGASGRLTFAIAQFDQWLPAHSEDARRADALHGRCRARAQLGQDLKKALSDCNDALRVYPNSPRMLEARGLVRLRMSDFDKSIADYDAALGANPKLAWALYGRGLDELHLGKRAEGQADMAKATALQPDLPEEAKRLGLTP